MPRPRRPIATLLFLICWIGAAVFVAQYIGRSLRVDTDAAQRALSEDGYREISVSSRPKPYSFLAGCDRHYDFVTPFEATISGRRAEGVVCSGGTWGKAPQVRRSR